jgi:hypothetical protein
MHYVVYRRPDGTQLCSTLLMTFHPEFVPLTNQIKVLTVLPI